MDHESIEKKRGVRCKYPNCTNLVEDYLTIKKYCLYHLNMFYQKEKEEDILDLEDWNRCIEQGHVWVSKNYLSEFEIYGTFLNRALDI